MSWRTAFLAQARSDNDVRKLLNREQVPYSHQLHYLQMVSEKLAKGFMTSPSTAEPLAFSHSAFVSCLRVLKGRPEIRRQLGYSNVSVFSSFIDSLLPLAEKIERLAPTSAGKTQPNPEYPWQPNPTVAVIIPSEFEFPELKPDSVKIVQLIDLINKPLSVAG